MELSHIISMTITNSKYWFSIRFAKKVVKAQVVQGQTDIFWYSVYKMIKIVGFF